MNSGTGKRPQQPNMRAKENQETTPPPQHEELIKFICDSWNKVCQEYQKGAPTVSYHTENEPNPQLKVGGEEEIQNKNLINLMNCDSNSSLKDWDKNELLLDNQKLEAVEKQKEGESTNGEKDAEECTRNEFIVNTCSCSIENKESWEVKEGDMKILKFMKRNGINANCLKNLSEGTPYDYFCLLFDDEILNLFVSCTNTIGSARHSSWKIVSKKEFLCFLARLFKNDLLNVMNEQRFSQILECLQFSKDAEKGGGGDNPSLTTGTDGSIPLVNLFNEKMSEVYTANKVLVVERREFLNSGEVSRFERGPRLELHSLVEPQGVIVKLHLCESEGDSDPVVDLLRGLLNSGHCIYVNESYSSLKLAAWLLKNGNHCTGKLSSDSPEVPHVINCENASVAYREGLMVGSWKDVIFFSTEFDRRIISFEDDEGRIEESPLALVKYKNYVLKSRKSDVLEREYPLLGQVLSPHQRLCVLFFRALLTNAYHLGRAANKAWNNFQDFLSRTLHGLLTEAEIEPPPRSLMKKQAGHTPSKCRNAMNGKPLNRKCRLCARFGKKTDTRFSCEYCPDFPGLCLEPCFKIYHDEL